MPLPFAHSTCHSSAACFSVAVRRQRRHAHMVQLKSERDRAAQQSTAVAEASARKKGSAKKKKSKKGADDMDEDDDAGAAAEEKPARVANQLYPEYALLDLIYVLSYDPQFRVNLGAVSAMHTQESKRVGCACACVAHSRCHVSSDVLRNRARPSSIACLDCTTARWRTSTSSFTRSSRSVLAC